MPLGDVGQTDIFCLKLARSQSLMSMDLKTCLEFLQNTVYGLEWNLDGVGRALFSP